MPHAARLALVLLLALVPACAKRHSPAPRAAYVPPRGEWAARPPEALGFDAAKLADAVAWAKTQETDMPRDFSTQREIFGRPLGPVPTTRALTNGIIIRHGYIAAEWGDTSSVDPSYSIAKSYLSTLLGLAVDRGLIRDIHEPVGAMIHDGGYDSPHNAKVTWAHHVTQTSEWDGEMFGKKSDFLDPVEFGRGAYKPRVLREPGSRYEYNDVRVNRMSLSLLRVWQRPLPEVLRDEIMNPIGASDTWKYLAYDNATVDLDGHPVPSVSGGTRWGAGLWMATRDHARFGLLMLRHGLWGDKRILSESWIRDATRQEGVEKGYGYLWWLNSEGRWPAAPRGSFAAQGAGNNSVWVDPDDDLVIVWRWHRPPEKGLDPQAKFYQLVIGALTDRAQSSEHPPAHAAVPSSGRPGSP